jgi:hypothetical protein
MTASWKATPPQTPCPDHAVFSPSLAFAGVRFEQDMSPVARSELIRRLPPAVHRKLGPRVRDWTTLPPQRSARLVKKVRRPPRLGLEH